MKYYEGSIAEIWNQYQSNAVHYIIDGALALFKSGIEFKLRPKPTFYFNLNRMRISAAT